MGAPTATLRLTTKGGTSGPRVCRSARLTPTTSPAAQTYTLPHVVSACPCIS